MYKVKLPRQGDFSSADLNRISLRVPSLNAWEEKTKISTIHMIRHCERLFCSAYLWDEIERTRPKAPLTSYNPISALAHLEILHLNPSSCFLHSYPNDKIFPVCYQSMTRPLLWFSHNPETPWFGILKKMRRKIHLDANCINRFLLDTKRVKRMRNLSIGMITGKRHWAENKVEDRSHHSLRLFSW